MNKLGLNNYYDNIKNKIDVYTETKINTLEQSNKNQLLKEELDNKRKNYIDKIQIEIDKLHTVTEYTEFNIFTYDDEQNILYTYTTTITLGDPNIKEVQDPKYFFIKNNCMFFQTFSVTFSQNMLLGTSRACHSPDHFPK